MIESANASRCGFDGFGFLRTDVHATGVEPCPSVGDGGDSVPWTAHCGGGVADHGVGGQRKVLQLPPGVEPGALVGFARGENPAGTVGRIGRSPKISADYSG